MLINNFETTGSGQNIKTPVHAHPGHSTENINAVRKSIEEDPFSMQKLLFVRIGEHIIYH